VKILLANDQHWPMLSGPATVVRLLARTLAVRGHKVLVLAPSQTGWRYGETDENYRIERLPSFSPFIRRDNLRISPIYAAEIRGLLRGFQPDVVHIHTPGGVGLTTLHEARKLDLPIAATNHLMGINIYGTLKWLKPFKRPINHLTRNDLLKLYKNADRIIMPTQLAIDQFNLAKIKAPVSAISNGINLEKFHPGKASPAIYQKFHLPTDKPIVSYLGRLDSEKHLPVILRAAPRILAAISGMHFLFVGTGNDAEHLKKLAEAANLSGCAHFTGRVDDDDMAELHRVGRVYVMPSPAELQSVSTLEAMASGQPIVAADAGALPELCQNGQNGLLFPVDDDEKLADGVIKILSNPDLRKKFAARSLEIARTHDIKNVIKQFERIYRAAIKDHLAHSRASKIPVGKNS
jgi:glycosyltransferase involved in cell wall biosynthesis